MWPLAIPLISAAASLGSSALGANSGQQANRTNVRLQRQQQDWEEHMSNTAVLRRKQDIERAGGNPALAFTSGSEASTPSVQPAHVDPVPYNTPDLTSGFMMKKQVEAIDAGIGLTAAQTDVAHATAQNVRQQTVTGANTAKNLEQQTTNLQQQLDNIKADLAGKLTANEIAAIDANVKGKTQDQQVAIIEANLRRAKAEATSAEKKALLDQALVDFINYAQRLGNQLLKPTPGKSPNYIRGKPAIPKNRPKTQWEKNF